MLHLFLWATSVSMGNVCRDLGMYGMFSLRNVNGLAATFSYTCHSQQLSASAFIESCAVLLFHSLDAVGIGTDTLSLAL